MTFVDFTVVFINELFQLCLARSYISGSVYWPLSESDRHFLRMSGYGKMSENYFKISEGRKMSENFLEEKKSFF